MSVVTLALTMYKPDERHEWESPTPVGLSNERALKAKLKTGDSKKREPLAHSRRRHQWSVAGVRSRPWIRTRRAALWRVDPVF